MKLRPRKDPLASLRARKETPPEVRERVVRHARMQLAIWARDRPGNCLLAAAATVLAGRGAGLPIQLQAGTAFWQRTASDDFATNAFGYQWMGLDDPETRAKIVADMLPEMHAWAGIPERGELVDLAARDFPSQCARLIGQPWELPPPPDVLWATGKTLPIEADYRPFPDAIAVGLLFLRRLGIPLD